MYSYKFVYAYAIRGYTSFHVHVIPRLHLSFTCRVITQAHTSSFLHILIYVVIITREMGCLNTDNDQCTVRVTATLLSYEDSLGEFVLLIAPTNH